MQAYLSELGSKFIGHLGVACHLLRSATSKVAAIPERQIRGGMDVAAERIVIAVGYRQEALEGLLHAELGEMSLERPGAKPEAIHGLYRLAYAATASDFATN